MHVVKVKKREETKRSRKLGEISVSPVQDQPPVTAGNVMRLENCSNQTRKSRQDMHLNDVDDTKL